MDTPIQQLSIRTDRSYWYIRGTWLLLAPGVEQKPELICPLPITDITNERLSWIRNRCDLCPFSRYNCPPSSTTPCVMLYKIDRNISSYYFGPRAWSGESHHDAVLQFMGLRRDQIWKPNTVSFCMTVAHEMAHERQQYCNLSSSETLPLTIFQAEREAEDESLFAINHIILRYAMWLISRIRLIIASNTKIVVALVFILSISIIILYLALAQLPDGGTGAPGILGTVGKATIASVAVLFLIRFFQSLLVAHRYRLELLELESRGSTHPRRSSNGR